MTFEVVWSEFAENQLDEIYEFYKKEAGPKIAKKIITGIIREPNRLVKTPLIGQEEALLKHRKIHYRYLIFKNYKLIYSVDKKNGFINIADVFDTRQYPQKIKRAK